MTQQEAKKKFWGKNGIFEQFCSVSYKKIVSTYYEGHRIDDFIDQIYNDHKAQLKAKDEEIKELGEIVQQYLIPSKNYDAIIKAKDEEIERLKAKHEIQLNHRKAQSARLRRYNPSRSIVAMLFWEWRKSEARIYATNIKWKTGRAFQSQILFEAAYKILKDTK